MHPIFIEAFTIDKLWKQPKCPSTGKWIEKMWDTHTHTRMFSSAEFSRSVVSDSLWPHESQHARPPCPCSHKKEWHDVICSNMDGPWDCHTEWSKSDKHKYWVGQNVCLVSPKDIMEKPEQTFVQPSVIQYHLCVESELIHKNRNRVTDVQNKLMVTRV